MTLNTFLEQLQSPNFFTGTSRIIFTGTDYPILLFSAIIERIKKIYPNGCRMLDVSEQDFAATVSNLEMSFLGAKTIFWLRNIDDLDEKTKKKLISYISHYSGPNGIICFSQQVPAGWAEIVTVILPTKIDKNQYIQLLDYEQPGLARKYQSVITEIFKRIESLSLDQVYSTMRYLALVGTSHDLFTKTWLDSIIIPEKSLFTLSQHFFAKDARNFFVAWAHMHEEYQDTFWITFWSEQIWRACNVVRYMQNKQFAQAKSMAYRLPFSFVQRDWKKYSTAELQRVHHALYQRDYNLKNGTEAMLEIFYSNFMLDRFKH